MNSSSLLWGLFFSSIGLGYAIYGKRQRAMVPFLSGLALMVFSYFVPDATTLVIIGGALAALPYFVRV